MKKQRINPNILCQLRIINEPGFGQPTCIICCCFLCKKIQKKTNIKCNVIKSTIYIQGELDSLQCIEIEIENHVIKRTVNSKSELFPKRIYNSSYYTICLCVYVYLYESIRICIMYRYYFCIDIFFSFAYIYIICNSLLLNEW